MTPTRDFEAILSAARAGAEWAWRELYHDFAPIVLRYLRARNAPEPDDLTGEVFVQVVRKLHQFEGGAEDFRAWITTIAHHRLLDGYRSRSRRPVDPVADEALVVMGGVGDPESDALDRVESTEVYAAISRLSPDQRDVIFLRLIAGMSVKEVAAAVGKKPGAVKALQVRGLAALRRDLPQGVSL